VVRENQVVVVVGETGSGKTTQLTQVLLPSSFPCLWLVLSIIVYPIKKGVRDRKS